MDDALFSELLGAANEAVAHHRGRKRDLRTTVLPEPPRPMSRTAVKRLRASVGASQPVFAHFLNVSPKLVQAWEGGTRTPDGPALVLLRLAVERPEAVFAVGADQAAAAQRRPARSRSGGRGRGKRSLVTRSNSAAVAPRKERSGSAHTARHRTRVSEPAPNATRPPSA